MSDSPIRVEDSYTLNYARDWVWKKLNDPVVLRDCIRGCRNVERQTQHNFRAVIQARVGELRKDFHVDLHVDDEHAPAKYILSTDMSAGLFGKVSGRAEVELVEEYEGKTTMHYLAILSGTGLVGKALPVAEGIARRRVHEFFDEFVRHLSAAC